MTRAQIIDLAYQVYPISRRIDDDGMPYDAHADLQMGFIHGYERAQKDILAIIESRIGEIMGDAQPRPAMRAELRELISKIKEEQE